MSTSNTFFPTGGPFVGVNFATTNTTADFPVGSQVIANNGKFEYVYALSGIAQYDAVVIGVSGNAQPATTTLAATVKKVGFAQVAIASGSYGWVAREGNGIRVSCAANCAANAQLYTTATAGVLDDAIVTQGALHGVIALGSISNATATPVLAASPHIGYGSAN
jgi:hypothetical protein